MLIISQNASNYGIPFPDGTIYRINLAWIDNLEKLNELLEKHSDQKIFLDLPVGRLKPPNNKYSLQDLLPIIQKFNNVTYFAISNVNSADDLNRYLKFSSEGNIILVPKIEHPDGIKNIRKIIDMIPSKEKIVMLDHDDLYSSILKLNESPTLFPLYIEKLIQFCNDYDVTLLRTIGVIFSSNEKKVTQYIG